MLGSPAWAKKETMLTHPTQERLTALGLTGMAKALEMMANHKIAGN